MNETTGAVDDPTMSEQGLVDESAAIERGRLTVSGLISPTGIAWLS